MSSEQTGSKHTVTPGNWRQYADRIHTKAMEKMEIPQGTFEEAVFLALATGGEAGEFQNVVKKMWRDGQSEELHKKMRGEIADVLIYLDHFLNSFQLSATAIICEKVQELTERWPEYFEDFEPQKAN